MGGEAQAEELLVSAQEWHEVDVRPSESLTDATLKIQRMDIRLTQLHEEVERLIHMTEMSSELISATSHTHKVEGRKGNNKTKMREVPEQLSLLPGRIEHLLNEYLEKAERNSMKNFDRRGLSKAATPAFL